MLSGGLALTALTLNYLPFFDEPIGDLNEQGILPAGIAYTVGVVALGCLLFWSATYLLRWAAASPRASRRFVLLMDPSE